MEKLTKLLCDSIDLMVYSNDKSLATFASFIVYKLLDKKYNLNITEAMLQNIKLVKTDKQHKDIINNYEYLMQCYNVMNYYIIKTNDIILQLLLIMVIQLIQRKYKLELQLPFSLIKNIMLHKLNIIERYKIHKVLIEAPTKNPINHFIIKIISNTKLLF